MKALAIALLASGCSLLVVDTVPAKPAPNQPPPECFVEAWPVWVDLGFAGLFAPAAAISSGIAITSDTEERGWKTAAYITGGLTALALVSAIGGHVMVRRCRALHPTAGTYPASDPPPR
jgi:hypothetical protein